MTVEFRSLRQTELPAAQSLIAGLGVNSGLSDLRVLLSHDPDSVLAAFGDELLLGLATAVRYPWFNAFVSAPVVTRAEQGGELGKQLIEHHIKRLAGYNLVADVPGPCQGLFGTLGFNPTIGITCYTGMLAPPDEIIPGVVPVSTVQLSSLTAFDSVVFGRDRCALMKQWCAAPGAVNLCAVSGSAVTGYVVARPLRRGIGIGPLFATDEKTAHKLLASVADEIPPDTPIHCLVPSASQLAVSIVADLGLVPGEKFIRMCSNFDPVPDYTRWVFTASPELG